MSSLMLLQLQQKPTKEHVWHPGTFHLDEEIIIISVEFSVWEAATSLCANEETRLAAYKKKLRKKDYCFMG